mmetsp:Transcript_16529/g.46133  ORF Transcript_16529/g.46133 Transcript_16529/m.46133 type:complete len:225 (+) Transcript_16529:866-1540(+)
MHGRAAGRPGSAVRPHLSGCLCPGKGLGVGLGGGTWQHLLAAGAGRGQESDRSWILLSAEASRAGIQGLRVCLSATLGEGGVKRRVGRRWAWCSGHVAQCCHLSSASSMDVSTANLSESNASSYTPNRRRPHLKGWSIAAGILESTKCNAVEETQSSGFSDAQRVGAAGQGRSSAGVIPKLLERCRLMGSQCFWGNKNRDSYDTCHRESGSTTRTAPREPIYHP